MSDRRCCQLVVASPDHRLAQRSVLPAAPVPPEVCNQAHGRTHKVQGLHSVLACVAILEVKFREVKSGSAIAPAPPVPAASAPSETNCHWSRTARVAGQDPPSLISTARATSGSARTPSPAWPCRPAVFLLLVGTVPSAQELLPGVDLTNRITPTGRGHLLPIYSNYLSYST